MKIGRLDISLRSRRAQEGGVPALEVDAAGNFFNYVARCGYGFDRVPFTQANTLRIARTVAEVFFPIDAIAERAASVPFVLRDAAGEDVTARASANTRRLLERPNPYGTLSQLVYELLFVRLATGTSWVYRRPSSPAFSGARWVDGVYVVDPYAAVPVWYDRTRSYYDVKDYADVLAGVREGKAFIPVGDLLISVDNPDREAYGVYGSSPLHAVRRNVELVMDVYNARRNVYENNGIAGIISREADHGGAGVFEGGSSAKKRKEIADELLKRYNISNLNSIKAITTVPLKFIKTIATISELEPFRETYQDALAIAAAYQVPKHLIPTETQVTYENQRDSEVMFWQNVVLPYAREAAATLDKALALPEGWHLEPDASAVPALQSDRNTELDTERKEIENLQLLRELSPERAAEVDAALATIIERYNR